MRGLIGLAISALVAKVAFQRGWLVTAIGVLAIIVAFHVGYSRGVRDCPAQAEASAARQVAIERDIEWALSAPTDRVAICDQVFELIEGELGREALGEQAVRARRPDPLGE